MAWGQRGAELLLHVGGADAHGHHFGLHTLLTDSEGFLQGDLIEGVDGELHAAGLDPGTVLLHLYAYREVDDALDTHKYLHCAISEKR